MKKGFNKLVASVLSVSLMAGYTNIIPNSTAMAEENTFNGFEIAGEIGLDTSSAEVAEELEQLSSFNDNGVPDITVSENNEVSQINGTLSDTGVNTKNDALSVIDNISNLLGIDNAYLELKFESCTNSLYNDIYSFNQYYRGLEMVNSGITVIVNKETREPKFLNSSYVSDFSIDTTPQISEYQALDIVRSNCGGYSGSYPRLVIYTDDNGTSSLAWECNAASLTTGKVYVDAVNGGILFEEKLVQGAKLTNDGSEEHYYVDYNRLMPKAGSYYIDIDHNKSALKFFFRDKIRNIAILRSNLYWAQYEGGYFNIYTDVNGETKNIIYTDYGQNVFWKTVNNDDMYQHLSDYLAETATLYNAEKAYDFYKNTFGWIGADGKGSTLNIIPDIRDRSGYSVNNAFAFNGNNLLVFSANGWDGNNNAMTNWGADPDIAAHEFTHLVTHAKLNWGPSYNHETQALNEAYSDIMAEFADETPEWKHGTDLYFDNDDESLFIRNHVLPTSPQLSKYKGAGSLDYTDGHYGATIISHIAYIMHRMGIEDEVGMRIWYGSLDYLTGTKKDFAACRKAVLAAIGDAVYDPVFNGKYNDMWWDYTLMTNAAFNRSGVLPEDLLGDVDHDGIITKNDAKLLKLHLDGLSSLPTCDLLLADINMDSYVDMDDYVDYFFDYNLI